MSTAAVVPFRSFVQTPIMAYSPSPLRALVSSEYSNNKHHHHFNKTHLSLSTGSVVSVEEPFAWAAFVDDDI